MHILENTRERYNTRSCILLSITTKNIVTKRFENQNDGATYYPRWISTLQLEVSSCHQNREALTVDGIIFSRKNLMKSNMRGFSRSGEKPMNDLLLEGGNRRVLVSGDACYSYPCNRL